MSAASKASANRRRFGKKGAEVIKQRQGHQRPGFEEWTREQHKAAAAAFAESLRQLLQKENTSV